MELRELETFRAVVESGGMSHAASRLNRAQSSITARIRQLEASLGVSLFERDGRRVRLTAAGDALVDYADRLLNLADEARAAVSHDGVAGRLRLGAQEIVAATRLPRPLAKFHRRFQDVSVDLQTACSRDLLMRLQAGTLDLAIVGDAVDGERFTAVPWHVEELVLVAAVGEILHNPKRMADETMLLLGSSGCIYRRRFEQWLQMLRVVPARSLEFASYHAILAAAAAGVGFGAIPRSALDTYPQQDTVSVHAMPARFARVQTSLAIPRGRHMPALTRLIECLQEDLVQA